MIRATYHAIAGANGRQQPGKPADYQIYFSKFLIEAKQELKKQAIAEKKKAIEKAEEDKEDKKNSY